MRGAAAARDKASRDGKKRNGLRNVWLRENETAFGSFPDPITNLLKKFPFVWPSKKNNFGIGIIVEQSAPQDGIVVSWPPFMLFART